MNEALTITGATFAVLTALIFNRKDVRGLKADLKEKIGDLRGEMRACFTQVNARIDMMQAAIDRMQSDIDTFAIVNALHGQRLATLASAAKS